MLSSNKQIPPIALNHLFLAQTMKQLTKKFRLSKTILKILQGQPTKKTSKIRKTKSTSPKHLSTRSNRELLRKQTKNLVNNLLLKYNSDGRFPVNRIFIKDQKTRWGSCSELRNLNFNLRLAGLNPKLTEYVVVHELCHLIEFNHSPKFWHEVSKLLPHYLESKKQLAKIDPRKINQVYQTN